MKIKVYKTVSMQGCTLDRTTWVVTTITKPYYYWETHEINTAELTELSSGEFALEMYMNDMDHLFTPCPVYITENNPGQIEYGDQVHNISSMTDMQRCYEDVSMLLMNEEIEKVLETV